MNLDMAASGDTPAMKAERLAARAGAALPWLYLAIAMISYVAVPRLTHHALPLIEHDSRSYIDFWPYRDPAYPMLIRLCRATGLGLAAVPPIQIAVFAAALAVLRRSCAVAFGPIVALALVLAVAANPYVLIFHYMLMTESLFVAMVTLLLAFAIDALTRPRLATLAAMSVTVGIAALIRAAGWSLVPLLPIALLMAPHAGLWRRPAWLAAALLPVMLLLAAGSLFSHRWFGDDYTTQAPRILYEKSMLFAAGPSPYPVGSAEDRLWRLAEDEGAAVRSFLSRSPGVVAGAVLDSQYQGFLMTRYERQRILPLVTGMTDIPNGAAAERRMLAVAKRRIAARPALFLSEALSNTVFLWASPNNAMAYAPLSQAGLARGPWPLTERFGADFFAFPRPSMAKLTVSYAIVTGTAICGVLTLAILVAAAVAYLRRRRPIEPSLVLAAWCALGVHGNLVLLGFVAQPISRYFLAMWPMLAGAIVFGGVWLTRRRAPGQPFGSSESRV